MQGFEAWFLRKIGKEGTMPDFRSRQQQRKEESISIDQQLARLEEDIRRLKIDFDVYFNGGSKRPPHEARGRVEATIKRISDNRNLTYAQRYFFNNLVARYTSYRELWRRTLKARNEPTF
ncbi:MAG: hypothetical protein D6687_06010 [Acidobacteria bacterium]|nr:MAG: hypothetical protein D6687_06010 [Acidobacteriota bacterium]